MCGAECEIGLNLPKTFSVNGNLRSHVVESDDFKCVFKPGLKETLSLCFLVAVIAVLPYESLNGNVFLSFSQTR